MAIESDFTPYIRRWALAEDGEPILTRTSRLLPVRWNGEPAHAEDRDGA